MLSESSNGRTAQYVACLIMSHDDRQEANKRTKANKPVRGRSVDFNGIPGGNLICVTSQETEQAG
jgi:hypothetical protein